MMMKKERLKISLKKFSIAFELNYDETIKR